jgi:flagellin
MGLYVNTNQSAINSINYMNRTTQAMSTSFERLSSGLRINSAKDDAAGLSISSRLTSQIRGINQAVRNGGEGISLAQTAEGALNETTGILQRIRELAVQSANDTNNSSDRESLQAEVDQLVSELDKIAEGTNLNGINLIDGSFLSRNIQVGAQSDEGVSISIGGATTKHLGRQARYEGAKVSGDAIGGTGGESLTITNDEGTFNIRDTVEADDGDSTTLRSASAIAKANAINASSESSGVRAIVNKTVFIADSSKIASVAFDQENYMSINGVELSGFTVQENDADGTLVEAINAVSDRTGVTASLTSESFLQLTAEDGRNIEVDFVDADFRFFSANHLGFSTSDFTVNQGFAYVKTGSITLQSEKNFNLSSSDISVIGFSATGEGIYGVNSENSVSKLDISDRDGAIKALDTVDLAIEQTSSIRSMLGALQNRLQSTISNITVAQENLSASRSRIMDADFAQETAMLSRNQIIQQASVSIIAQAVQQPQSILALLGS